MPAISAIAAAAWMSGAVDAIRRWPSVWPIGMARTPRGHGARPKFPHHLFPHLGALGHFRHIQGLEREAGCLQPLVVAGYAVLVNDVASGTTT